MKTLISTYEYMMKQYELGNYSRVITHAAKLLRGFEENFHLKSFTLKGYSHLYEGQGLEALATFQEGVSRYPASTDLQYGLALTLYEVNNYKEASAILKLLQEEFPEDVELLRILINSLIALERYEEVLHYCAKAIDLEHDNYSLYLVMGQSHQEQGNYHDAIRFHESALALNDLNEICLADIHSSFGQTYLKKGDLLEAKTHFEESLNNDTTSTTYNDLGLTVALLGDHKKGLDLVNYSLGLDAYDPAAYLNRAKIRLLQQKPNKAKQDFEKAKRLGANQNDALQVKKQLDRYGD